MKEETFRGLVHLRLMASIGLVLIAAWVAAVSPSNAQQLFLPQFIDKAPIGEIVPGADQYGPLREDFPVMPALKNGEVIAWVFLTSDLVATTGYSGKPIHILMGIDLEAHITGVKLVKHSEPIVLVGIPNSKIEAVTQSLTGLDLAAEARARGKTHKLDIISGATVTVMIIDDSVVRAGLRVARALSLGGLSPVQATTGTTRLMVVDEGDGVADWKTLVGDGSVHTMTVSVAQINDAFAETGDARAIARGERGAPDDVFMEMGIALVSQPSIGRSLLGDAEYENLKEWLGEGEQAIVVMGSGRYSFKGSGYVRGGIFDRLQLIQGDSSVRFTDKQYRRIGSITAAGAPKFTEMDIFKIPSDVGFDPVQPFRLQVLVQRAIGAIEKKYTTFDLDYQLPDRFILGADDVNTAGHDELTHLWKRIWLHKRIEVALLLIAIGVLTAAFFFQMELTRHPRVTKWFRISFLTFTLVFIGWYANAQLSVVNVLAFANAVMTNFTWSAFLMDPLIFILWCSVAASLLFWGRGAYCGWLCPFGALQELTNKLARLMKVPQITVPWGIHERLWPVKYIIFLGLFGVSMYSLELAEHYSEVEPFKTAIILKFARAWPFVLYAVVLLGAGLFIERFYCRYLCPLGAALAIPGRMRMFDWLKRYRDCGNPCQRCANECMVQAIHPEGNINPNECHQCLHCQVLYQSETDCPVCIRKLQRRQRRQARSAPSPNLVPASASTPQVNRD